MDEARALIERFERIERLERDGALPSTLLAEVRALLGEAEAWVRVEGHGADVAAAALERCRAAVERDAQGMIAM